MNKFLKNETKGIQYWLKNIEDTASMPLIYAKAIIFELTKLYVNYEGCMHMWKKLNCSVQKEFLKSMIK